MFQLYSEAATEKVNNTSRCGSTLNRTSKTGITNFHSVKLVHSLVTLFQRCRLIIQKPMNVMGRLRRIIGKYMQADDRDVT